MMKRTSTLCRHHPGTIQIDLEETFRFGVVDVDKDGRINGLRGEAESN